MSINLSTARRRLLLGAGAVLLSGQARASTLQVGQPAPRLRLTDLDDRVWDTAALRGKVVVLAFWASWCPPCRAELPLLSRWAASHPGLQVLGVSLDGPGQLATVRRIAAGLAFPVAMLGSPWAGDYGRIWRLPVSFVIDRSGRLADNGWSDAEPGWTESRLQHVVGRLLTE